MLREFNWSSRDHHDAANTDSSRRLPIVAHVYQAYPGTSNKHTSTELFYRLIDIAIVYGECEETAALVVGSVEDWIYDLRALQWQI